MNKTQIMLSVCNFCISYGNARLWLASSLRPVDMATGLTLTTLFIVVMFTILHRLAADKKEKV